MTCASTASSRAPPRSCTCSSPARRSTPTSRRQARSPREADLGQKAARLQASGFYAKWLPQLVVGKGAVPTSYAEFGPLATTCASSSDPPGSWPGRRSTGCRAGRAAWSTGSRSSAGWWTSGPSCSPWPRPAAVPRCCARTTRPGRAAASAGGRLLRPVAAAGRRAVRSAVGQQRRRRPASRRPCSAGDFTWLEEARARPERGHRPVIAPWSPGPSESESVRRRYRFNLPTTGQRCEVDLPARLEAGEARRR